jgi:hypothetical protein
MSIAYSHLTCSNLAQDLAGVSGTTPGRASANGGIPLRGDGLLPSRQLDAYLFHDLGGAAEDGGVQNRV